VIVIDDGSTDSTLAITQAWVPAVRAIHQANAGPAAARNRGIEIAGGAYLAFNDADDRWTPGRLVRQLAILESRPDLDLVMGLVEMEYPAQAPANAARFRSAQDQIALFSFGAGLFRRRVFQRIGPLSEDLRNTEDADWFMRAREGGAAWLVENEPALIYRRHGTNMTERLPLAKSEVFRVLARATARRRARPAGDGPALDRLSDRRATDAGDKERKR
jgi:glycosyltransferase involved in cell wall biosynthesis